MKNYQTPDDKAEDLWNLIDIAGPDDYKSIRNCCLIVTNQMLDFDIELSGQQREFRHAVREEIYKLYEEKVVGFNKTYKS